MFLSVYDLVSDSYKLSLFFSKSPSYAIDTCAAQTPRLQDSEKLTSYFPSYSYAGTVPKQSKFADGLRHLPSQE